MDELGTLSPASRERSLDELPRKELQQLAKEAGVKGNIKSKDIVQSLLRCLEGEAAVPGTVKKARPATSALALARADTNDSGDSSDSTGNRSLHATLDEALAHTSDSQQLTAPSGLLAKSEDATQPVVTAESLLEHIAPAEAAQHAAQTADDSGASAAARLGSGNDTHSPVSGLPSVHCQAVHTEVADATANIAIAAETAQPLQQECEIDDDAAAAAAADSDGVSNPLFEEPDPLRPVPVAAADSALPHEIAMGESDGSALQLEISSAGGMQEYKNKQDAEWLGPAEASAEQPPENMDQDLARPTEVSDVSLTAAATAGAQPKDDHPDPMDQDAHVLLANEGTSGTMQVFNLDPESQPIGPQPVHSIRAPQAEEEQRRREATPEELANLGKAVDMVQARSCQLSPSLLTVGQNPDGLDSPAQDAFERGRKSGIWQGSTEVELRQLERQWDDYKSVATRGWDLPNLQDVQAKSDALEASGFATVHSPLISKATQDAMAKQGAKGGKRKARSEEGKEELAAAGKAAGQSRKVVKRAQGHTPSRKGGPPVSTLKGQSPAAKGPGPSSSTPLRHLNGARGVQGGLSRLAHSTHAADVENAAKASNGTPAAQGKVDGSEGGGGASPFSVGATQKESMAGVKATKVTGIPKPRPAIDRAKKAEATFAARRAAALAKVKK
ncbi:hypothetical protein WJX77_011729 [Trebouxia sp. C0004]